MSETKAGEYLRLEAGADRLGCSSRHLYTLARRGLLTLHRDRVSGRSLVRADEVERLAAERLRAR